jgi:hypothetical protein
MANPWSQPTEVYLGYDEKNLYAFVCHDDPAKIRAHETRRDSRWRRRREIMLDTFHDRRRAYVFQVVNPKGARDAIWTEATYEEQGGNFDASHSTRSGTRAGRSRQGYVVLDRIPFRSLRPIRAGPDLGSGTFARNNARERESLLAAYFDQ